MVDETQYITALLSTLDNRFQYAVSNFRNCKRKKEAFVVIDAAMELRFPFHNRRIQTLAENNKAHEEASAYVERLLELFKNAQIENMNWCNLLIHQTLNKVLEKEAHIDIRKTISAYLSELGATDVPTILNRIKSIEADRRSRGYP